jgi:hypothetical protein
MAHQDPDYQQTFQATARAHAQRNYVPQTVLVNGYNNNHVKNNTHTSDTFANDSNDKAMRHVPRFRAQYPSQKTLENMGNMRFISRGDEY